MIRKIISLLLISLLISFPVYAQNTGGWFGTRFGELADADKSVNLTDEDVWVYDTTTLLWVPQAATTLTITEVDTLDAVCDRGSITDQTGTFGAIRTGSLILTVKKINDLGVETHYATTADTDAARGVALTAAITASADGDTIVIGTGTFAPAAALEVVGGTTIMGRGENTIIERSGIVFQLTSDDNVMFTNLTISGQLDLHGSDDLTLQNIWVDANSQSYCVYLHDSSFDVRVYNSFFRNATTDNFRVEDSGVWGCKFQGNHFSGATSNGMTLDGSDQSGSGRMDATIITGNTFLSNSGIGLSVNSVHDCLISINQFERNGTDGVYIARPVEVTLEANFFEYNDQSGEADEQAIHIDLESNAGFGFTTGGINIIGNICQGEKENIDIKGTADVAYLIKISENILYSPDTAGESCIRFTDYRSNYVTQISNNILRGNSNTIGVNVDGVAGSTNADELEIMDNSIYDHADGIVLNQVDNILIKSNHIWDNTDGIDFDNSSSASLIGNYVRANTTDYNDDGGTINFLVTYDGDVNFVGIGTKIPNVELEIGTAKSAITGTDVDVSELSLKIHNVGDDNDEALGIGFSITSSPTSTGAAIIHERVGSHSQGKLHFATRPTGLGVGADIPIRMTINDDGNVGIGITTPTSKIHITGGTNGTSNWLSLFNNNSNEVHKFYVDATDDGIYEMLNNGGNTNVAIDSSTGQMVLGTNSFGASTNPGFLHDRTITANSNAHPFTDKSAFNPTTNGWAIASFDGAFTTGGSTNMNHAVSFQANPTHDSSGTLGNLQGFTSILVNNGGAVTNAWQYKAKNATGTGTVTNQVAYFVQDTLNKGSSTNYAFYDAGNNDSYLASTARLGIGITPAVGGSALNVQVQSSGSSNGLSVFNVDSEEVIKMYTDSSKHGVLELLKDGGSTVGVHFEADGNSYLTGAITVGGDSDTAQLVVKANAGQTDNMFEIRDSSNNLFFWIDATGNLHIKSGNKIIYDE